MLNLYEVKIWTALLSRGVSTAGELSDIANVPRSRTYDVLESLEKKGFIIMKLGKPIKDKKGNLTYQIQNIKIDQHKKYIFFFDEINRTPKDVIPFLFSLLGEGSLLDKTLPKDTLRIAAGNPDDDLNDVDSMADAAMQRRLMPIILDNKPKDWLKWAKGSGIHPLVYSFIKYNNDLLYDHATAKKGGNIPFANPASWEKVSDLITAEDLRDTDNFETIKVQLDGLLNSTIASKFYTESISALFSKASKIDMTEFIKEPNNFEKEVTGLIKKSA